MTETDPSHRPDPSDSHRPDPSNRELVMLGTASQVPTRERNHHATALRFDDELLLFDPGEGTQRQLLHAGLSAAKVTRVLVTHWFPSR